MGVDYRAKAILGIKVEKVHFTSAGKQRNCAHKGTDLTKKFCSDCGKPNFKDIIDSTVLDTHADSENFFGFKFFHAYNDDHVFIGLILESEHQDTYLPLDDLNLNNLKSQLVQLLYKHHPKAKPEFGLFSYLYVY